MSPPPDTGARMLLGGGHTRRTKLVEADRVSGGRRRAERFCPALLPLKHRQATPSPSVNGTEIGSCCDLLLRRWCCLRPWRGGLRIGYVTVQEDRPDRLQ